MRKFFVAVFALFSLLFLSAIVVGLFLSGEFKASQSVVVDASKERLYSFVGDLNKWPEWGPWHAADESLEVTLGDKVTGVGAAQSWVGKDGNGRLVFTEADPSSGVVFDLYFNDDAFYNLSAITYEENPEGEGLIVTWSMQGVVEAPVVGGYLALMMPGMVGPMFDDGLEKLKSLAEAP